MRYKIMIEGGFAGIPREYEGKITVQEANRKKLLEALNRKMPSNDQMRDSLVYHIELEDKTGIFKGSFEESNLPLEIRNFINGLI